MFSPEIDWFLLGRLDSRNADLVPCPGGSICCHTYISTEVSCYYDKVLDLNNKGRELRLLAFMNGQPQIFSRVQALLFRSRQPVAVLLFSNDSHTEKNVWL